VPYVISSPTLRFNDAWLEPGPFTLTLAYKTAARDLAEKKIALAGAPLQRF
jgi:hypothetical protein